MEECVYIYALEYPKEMFATLVRRTTSGRGTGGIFVTQ